MTDERVLLKQLSEPFPPSDISWRAGATKDNKCLALTYADPRVYMKRLDEVCGMDWQVRYVPWHGERIICEVTIYGVTRSSTGEMDSREEKSEIGGTAAEAQAFKRACAMFGVGRFIYELSAPWVDYDPQKKAISKSGLDELTRRYEAWYHKTMAQRAVQEPVNTSLDFSPEPSVAITLPADAQALIAEVSQLHRESDGACTSKQYQYLTGLIDSLTNNQHNVILSMLCKSQIDSTNMPGRKAAGHLLKMLARTVAKKDTDGNPVKDSEGKTVMVPNPDYDYDACLLITRIAQQAILVPA